MDTQDIPVSSADVNPFPAVPKPGWQTSEFWLMLLLSLVSFMGDFAGYLPHGDAVAGACVSIYGILRVIIKLNHSASLELLAQIPAPQARKGFSAGGAGGITRALIALLLVGALALSGCEAIGDWAATPGGQKTVSAIESFVLNAGVAALSQYATDGYVDGRPLIQGGAALVRSLQSTPKAGSSSAITAAIRDGAAGDEYITRTFAPLVNRAVRVGVAQGLSPSQALEAAAVGLDRAAVSQL